MSRHGYTDDDSDDLGFALWRGRVMRAIRGKRGQAFLRRMEAALEAMPEKRLVAHHIIRPSDGACCALGAVYKHEGIAPPELFDGYSAETENDFDESDLDEHWLNDFHCSRFDIADALAREIQYENDECSLFRRRDDPRGPVSTEEQERHRYETMLRWVRCHIQEATA